MTRQDYRHELKYRISFYQYLELRSVIAAIMQRDENTVDAAGYNIRSLYFDDIYHSAYNEKEDGIGVRKKYRVRIYNYSDKSIKLECKHKNDTYIFKEALSLVSQEYEQLMQQRIGFLLDNAAPLAKEFYIDYRCNVLRPTVIVDYEREAYIDTVGSVRITFDKDIKSGYSSSDIFNKNIPLYSVFEDDSMILEVKFTKILPEKIKKLFTVKNYTRISASKFMLCAERLSNSII